MRRKRVRTHILFLLTLTSRFFRVKLFLLVKPVTKITRAKLEKSLNRHRIYSSLTGMYESSSLDKPCIIILNLFMRKITSGGENRSLYLFSRFRCS